MKLRQKLAIVLASAMIVAAVPVVTSAASTNTLSHTISLKENMTVGFAKEAATTTGISVIKKETKHPKLQLKLSGNYSFDKDGYTFYVNMKDGKFSKEAFAAYAAKTGNAYINANGKLVDEKGTLIGNGSLPTSFEVEVKSGAVAEVNYVNEDQIEVNVKAKGTDAVVLGEQDIVQIPLLFTAKKGEPTIEVIAKNSVFSGSKLVLTNEQVSDKALTVKAADAKTISVDGGEIAKITVEEVVLGALNSGTDKDRQITVKLPNSSDLEFSNIKTVKIKGTYGLNNVAAANGTAQVISNDGKEMVIQLPKVASTKNTTGAIEITGITVSPEGRDDAKLGKVDVTIKGGKIDTVKATVAEVKAFDVLLENTDKVELVAGKDAKEVKVTLKESAANSLDERRTIFFSVEGAEFNDTTIKASKGTVKKVYSKDKEPKLIGFDLDLQGALTSGKANEVEIKFEVAAKANQSGNIKVVAESRSFAKNVEASVGTVKPAVKVAAKAMTVKVGLQGQVGGEIVINETEAGMLERNKQIIIDVVDAKNNGITLKDAKVKAENLQVTDMEIKDGQMILTVKRTSDQAGKITLSDIKVDVNRLTPEGKFDVKIGGDAISSLNKVVKDGNKDTMKDVIKVANFIVVGTPNTEDNNNGLQKGTGIFKVGAKTYTVNGEAKEMDAAPYISKANRVMVPVRYVSDVFGINGKDVLFSNENGGTITIFAGSRVLQVINGSNVALVNGVKIPMDEKVTIVDGRTFVPVGEMARLLNVNVEWSNETKTATFKN